MKSLPFKGTACLEDTEPLRTCSQWWCSRQVSPSDPSRPSSGLVSVYQKDQMKSQDLLHFPKNFRLKFRHSDESSLLGPSENWRLELSVSRWYQSVVWRTLPVWKTTWEVGESQEGMQTGMEVSTNMLHLFEFASLKACGGGANLSNFRISGICPMRQGGSP